MLKSCKIVVNRIYVTMINILSLKYMYNYVVQKIKC